MHARECHRIGSAGDRHETSGRSGADRNAAGAAAALAVWVAGAAEPVPARAQSSPAVPGDVYAIDGLARGGNVYLADGAGNRVLEVAGTDHVQWGIRMTSGDVYVIAGSPAGVPGASGKGTKGAPTSRLTDPAGPAMDDSGDLFIADSGNERVSWVSNPILPKSKGHSAPGSQSATGTVPRPGLVANNRLKP